METVHRRYGFGSITKQGATVNTNKKGGMDTIQFAKYLELSIVPLYLDEPGRQVTILVDTVPG